MSSRGVYSFPGATRLGGRRRSTDFEALGASEGEVGYKTLDNEPDPARQT